MTKRKQMKKTLFIALAIGFLLFGVGAFLQSKPSAKNSRLYKIVQTYSPYYLDKRFGGLQIMSKSDEAFLEKPSNTEVFHRFETLEKQWGQKHMKIEENVLIIHDDSGSVLKRVSLENADESAFVHRYYGI